MATTAEGKQPKKTEEKPVEAVVSTCQHDPVYLWTSGAFLWQIGSSVSIKVLYKTVNIILTPAHNFYYFIFSLRFLGQP